jgi:hypothetical protein
VHQEQYAVAAVVQFERGDEMPRRVSLVLDEDLRIEATLGSDHRYEGDPNGP